METNSCIYSVTNVMAKITWKVRTINLTLALTLTLTITPSLDLKMDHKKRKVKSSSSVYPPTYNVGLN